MKKTAFTLIEVMFVVTLIAILATLAIPGIMQAKMNANQASAKSTLKGFSGALEQYMLTNGGYPTDINLVVGPNPPYYPENIIGQIRNGYTYGMDELNASTYAVWAAPIACRKTGSKRFVASPGNVISEEDCI
jgi:prepilin-type N-terminal cleavage/methylation domain-containing protein